MIQDGSLTATGGNAGSTVQPADAPGGTPNIYMPIVADQTSPPRKQLRQDDGGSGQDLSAIHAWGKPHCPVS